ncbi:UNVERIFIED_CONTAM: hypothetical protein FKN15_028406 [Acipenser sinensis]
MLHLSLKAMSCSYNADFRSSAQIRILRGLLCDVTKLRPLKSVQILHSPLQL